MPKQESPAEAWAEQWQQAQRRYWDAWMDMARETGQQHDAAQPWAQSLEHWWKTMSGTLPDSGQDLMHHLVGLGKAYFSLAEGLAKSDTPHGDDMMGAVSRWTEQMGETLRNMTSQLQQPFGKPPGAAATFWDLPLDTWQRTWSAAMPFPGDWMKALRPEDAGADLHAGLERFLSIPAVGYTREAQEQHQTLARLMLDYQQALREFQLGLSQSGLEAVEDFRRLLTERAASEDAEPLTSVRQIYDLWVDACENAYATYAQSDEYAERYGRMVNALMALKRQGARLVDEQLEAMNMPTRREVSTLQKRLHETRREQHALRAEIERLNERLAALAPDEPTVSRPARAATKRATRKPTPKAAPKSAAKTASKTAPKKPARPGRRQ
ncbi:MAG: class III poly(R)-hydroxyalkanoic acid synthase subunit PhaE [Chromatiales bacterium]|nr:class III poly(R)-hydroxyalkanoic acid synthase subunit PhaE [Chromatiales bacterium]